MYQNPFTERFLVIAEKPSVARTIAQVLVCGDINNNGARIKAPDGTTEPVTMDFYRRAAYCASLPHQRFDDTTNKRF